MVIANMHKVTPLLALIILCGLMGSNLAYADYTEYINMRIPQNIPNVCIFEAEEAQVNFQERDLYNKTVNWIQEGWIDNLNNHTNSNNWDMTFEYIPNATHYSMDLVDFPQCHVMIVWDAENDGSRENLGKAQGYTAFDHAKSTHKYAFINVFTWAPTNNISLGQINFGNMTANEKGEFEIDLNDFTFDYEEVSDEGVRIVVQHEFGHALGLGHYFTTLTYNYDSIMPPQVEFNGEDEYLVTFQITEYDLEAVVQFYGKDGLKSHIDPPFPDNGFGWNESTLRGSTPITGDFLVKFPNVLWLDPNFGTK